MENNNLYAPKFVGIPFYIFVSILLGVLGSVGTISVFHGSSLMVAVIYGMLFLSHIGLYWATLRFLENESWFTGYAFAQVVLIAVLVNFPYERPLLGGTILASAVVSLIGQTLGLWGNTKKAFRWALFFAATALVLLYFVVGKENYSGAAFSFLINGGFIAVFLVILNNQLIARQKALDLAESLESANAKLAAYNAKIESLTLQNERQRMARELHDTLAQGVAGLVLQLEAVKAHLASNRTERAIAIVEQSIDRARSTLAESRAAIDDLRAAPINVAEVVRAKVEDFKQSENLPCDLELSVTENQLTPEVIDHALNILSESLTNIARHAEATHVRVKFFIQKQTLELVVCDNGKGFDATQKPKGHYGLVGMHERARLTNGMLVIESNKDGTCVQFGVGRV